MAKTTSRTISLKIAYKKGGMEAAHRSLDKSGGAFVNPDYVIQIARTQGAEFEAEVKNGHYSKLDARFKTWFNAEPEIFQTYRITLMFQEAFAIVALERKAEKLKAAEKAKRAERKARRAA